MTDSPTRELSGEFGAVWAFVRRYLLLLVGLPIIALLLTYIGSNLFIEKEDEYRLALIQQFSMNELARVFLQEYRPALIVESFNNHSLPEQSDGGLAASMDGVKLQTDGVSLVAYWRGPEGGEGGKKVTTAAQIILDGLQTQMDILLDTKRNELAEMESYSRRLDITIERLESQLKQRTVRDAAFSHLEYTVDRQLAEFTILRGDSSRGAAALAHQIDTATLPIAIGKPVLNAGVWPRPLLWALIAAFLAFLLAIAIGVVRSLARRVHEGSNDQDSLRNAD